MNSNLPIMTDIQKKNAPWNEKEIPQYPLHVCVSQTLHKHALVYTDDYIPEWDEEAQMYFPNTEETNWQNAYDKDNYTPEELLGVCKHLALDQLSAYQGNPAMEKYFENIIKSCEDWLVDETEYIED